MQIDRKTLDRLLNMNDAQLGALIQKIAAESGIDPAALGINPENISAIRQALGSATSADMEQYNQLYDEYRKKRRHT
ncbi:MAG: hypothetical protein E7666_06280 [Ruminococcaceae bacterium]|nr:hypothetical protein [Oscillospiraceae bacterium]